MTRWWAPLWGSPRGEKAEDSDEAQIEAIRRIRVDSPIEKDQDYGVDTSSREKLDRLNKDFVADDPELATSPKSIQLLEEAEAREYHQTRRRKIFLGVVVTMVVLLGLLGFVIFPRETYFHIVSLELDPNNSTYKDGDQLMTNWLAQVGIFNQNYYPISIRRINLKSYLDHNRNDPVGYGSGENLYFPSRSHVVNSVSFQMPVFAPSTGKPSIIAECMTTDRVDLFITAEMDLSWTHWTGRWIPVEFSASVDCKLPSVLKVMKRV